MMLPWFRGPLDELSFGYYIRGAVSASKFSGQRCGGCFEKHCVFLLFFPCLLLLTCDESRMQEEMSFAFAHCAICIYPRKIYTTGNCIRNCFPRSGTRIHCFIICVSGASGSCRYLGICKLLMQLLCLIDYTRKYLPVQS